MTVVLPTPPFPATIRSRAWARNAAGSNHPPRETSIRTLAIACLALGAAALGIGALGAPPAGAQEGTRHVDIIEVSGLIDPVEVDFIADALREAEEGAAAALVIQLNSRGAVVSRTRLDALTFKLAHARVPVAVWVGPSGARAYGGALQLLRAADVTAMAPGTRIGNAIHPVFDSASADPLAGRTAGRDAAARRGFVDLTSPTIGFFLVDLDDPALGDRQIDTARVVGTGEASRREAAVGVRFSKLPLLPRLLHTVASPPVAFLLLVVGLLLVVFEFFTAGIGVAGVTGAVCLALAGYGLAVLPTRPGAVALVAVGVLGPAIDVQAGAPRTWTVIGTLAMAAGAASLYDGHSVGWLPLLVAVVGVVLAMVGGMPAMVRARFSTPTIGRESMIGEEGTAAEAVDPDGVVRVRGALWRARTSRATPIAAGQAVRVVSIDGLLLEVEPGAEGRDEARADDPLSD